MLSHHRHSPVVYYISLHENREAEITDEDDSSKALCKSPSQRVELGAIYAEALEHAPSPVIDVNSQRNIGHHIQNRHRNTAKAGDHIVIRVAPHEVGIEPAPGEVGQMVEEIKQNDRPRPAHCARSIRSSRIAAPAHIRSVSPAAHNRQAPSRVNMQPESGDQPYAHTPENPGARHEVAT